MPFNHIILLYLFILSLSNYSISKKENLFTISSINIQDEDSIEYGLKEYQWLVFEEELEEIRDIKMNVKLLVDGVIINNTTYKIGDEIKGKLLGRDYTGKLLFGIYTDWEEYKDFEHLGFYFKCSALRIKRYTLPDMIALIKAEQMVLINQQ